MNVSHISATISKQICSSPEAAATITSDGHHAVFALSALQKVIDCLSKAAAEESDCFNQEDLDMVMETLFQVLWEDKEVAPVLDRRMSQILDIIDSRLNDQQAKGMGRP